MATTTLNVRVPQARTAPRLAQRIGEAAAAAFTLLTHTRRAARAAGEAARARQMAHQYDSIDPRMAADLYAAADRHDLVSGNV